MAATDSRRLADLDDDELDRLLPLIKVTPFAAHRTSAPGGCGCPCAATRRMEEGQGKLVFPPCFSSYLFFPPSRVTG